MLLYLVNRCGQKSTYYPPFLQSCGSQIFIKLYQPFSFQGQSLVEPAPSLDSQNRHPFYL